MSEFGGLAGPVGIPKVTKSKRRVVNKKGLSFHIQAGPWTESFPAVARLIDTYRG